MKRIGTSYAWWYNRKYQRIGHVFQGRFEAMLNGKPVTTLQLMEKQKRDEILRRSKIIEGATQRQIARVTGL